MTFASPARVAFLVLAITFTTTTAAAWPHKHGQKVRVRFLATSTLVRGTWGLNEDTYLAELRLGHDADLTVARLVDAYPNETPPLPVDALTSDIGTVLRVQRDPLCDRPFGKMLLRAAPGDPIAILPKRLGYQPLNGRLPEPKTILPCYRTVRR